MFSSFYLKAFNVDRAFIDDIIGFLREHLPCDLMPYLYSGLDSVDRIVFAKPYTRYSWMLVLNLRTSMFWVRNGFRELIVYLGRDPLWCIASLLSELVPITIHKTGPVCFGVLRYLPVYKTGLEGLYRDLVNEFIDHLDNCIIECEPIDLMQKFIPWIIAKDLLSIDYGRIAYIALHGDHEIIRYWLSMNPSRKHQIAVANALKAYGYNPENYGLKTTCERITVKNIVSVDRLCKLVEGADQDYCKMIEILVEVSKNPDKAWSILAPWREEIEPVIDYIQGFIQEQSIKNT